ncbi:MAG TPA: hypothetical protein VFP44_10195 [Usitatibacter sp.]|nr:hypothetical protein [Usitatibacter sp.]
MFRTFLAASLAAFSLLAAPFVHAAERFHAPRLQPSITVALEAPAEKRTGATVDADGRLKIGFVRALDKAAPVLAWTPADGGYVTRIEASSPEALGLRVRLDLGTVPGAMEARVVGSDGEIQSMTIDPLHGNEAWTPWTPGDSQAIEIHSAVAPSPGALRVGAVLHFTESPLAKAAAACTLSTACSAQDPAYDAAITERKKSLMRISFVDGGGGFLCSATLIDTPMRPAAFVLTANHCINNAASATSINSFWFYEETACGSGIAPTAPTRVSNGMQIVFTNFNVDSTLLLMNQNPPSGALYAPLNPALLEPGLPVVSVSHPRGDTSRYAIGTSGEQVRDASRPYDMYVVNFSRGIIEGGSSGSGIYTMSNGHLELRGVLSQGALDLSCTNPTALTLYARLEALYPEMAQYIGAATVAPDDAPNRPQDLFLAPIGNAGLDVPLDAQGQVDLENRHIDYAGDVDVYRFFLNAPHYVTVYSTGTEDLVGTIQNSQGVALEANDDAILSQTDHNFGITRRLEAGSYYLSVAHWDPHATGTYGVHLRTEPVDANYTDLWWNANEAGWGINIDHQGNLLFATLFTYDASGAPTWLVMSGGAKQADGSYQGDLFQAHGTPFAAARWNGASLAKVGTMRLSFTGNAAGTLSYTFDGTPVTKSIARQVFSTPPTCKWSAFDRTFSLNFQDLWWNPDEAGWGVNLTHQGKVLFATLFVYDANGNPQWYVMSAGGEGANRLTYSGALYQTRGPVFNASPWTGTTVTPVGNMSFAFTDGSHGTLTYTVNGVTVTKDITRQVFASPATDCDS